MVRVERVRNDIFIRQVLLFVRKKLKFPRCPCSTACRTKVRKKSRHVRRPEGESDRPMLERVDGLRPEGVLVPHGARAEEEEDEIVVVQQVDCQGDD